MLRRIVTGLLFALLMSVGLSWGQSYTVCPQDCPYSSIQQAINDAFPGDTITVGPGAYKEHLEIREKDLQLIGAGAGQVTLELVVESVRVGEERRDVGLLITTSVVTLKGFTVKGSGMLWLKNADVQLRENVFRGEGAGYFECVICVDGGLEFIAEDNRWEDYGGSWGLDLNLLKKGYALVRLRSDLSVLRRNTFARLKGLAIAVMIGQAILEENRFERVWRALQVGRPGRDPQIPEAFAQMSRNRLRGEGTSSDGMGDGILIYDEALLEENSISEFPGCAVWQSQPEFERKIRQIIVTDFLKHFLMVALYGAVEELPQASVLGKENSISTSCGTWCYQTYAQVLCPDQRFYPAGFGGGR
ncbi:MAG: hypothetical protein ACK4HB_06005 [Candidatus Bipolaricaulia bacterium]